ncbi:DOMON domain-containing protein [Adhaeretor mobilis]|uniref:Carbohydrate-binding domain-containing protein n=1 Tax=Adhaeretor mobilis TaxID=1930276 RepID=A0A517N2T6_9BACT|nr:hypothetical protein [Adhaeretor mobilis]QDT01451.1 hypothetical protein HG15A2_47930 [Adhaeretor mobilis]
MSLLLRTLAVLLLFVIAAHGSIAEEQIEQASHSTSLVASEADRAQRTRIRHIVHSRGANAASVAMLLQLARDLPEESSATLFAEMALEWHAAGEIDLACECRRTLLEKFPESPEAPHALLNLVQTYSSGEVSHAHRLTSAMPVSEEAQPTNKQMLTYASLFAAQVLQQNKEQLASPALTWQQGTLERLLGRDKAAIGHFTKLKHRPPGDAWRDRVDMENWLSEKEEVPSPIPTVACDYTASKPLLDGQTTDECWQRFYVATTKPQAVDACFSYDDEYLYIALRAQRDAECDYTPNVRPRPRDADLSEHDRVTIRLDTDRDYQSAYELTLDHRGWTTDACWGDATWNPEWFVAAKPMDNHWHVEAAISWKSLVATPPVAGDAWGVSVERFLPAARGLAAPSEKAASPQAAIDFSVLLFE